jgi:predicted nucleic acid-binding Zn ribbon protein
MSRNIAEHRCSYSMAPVTAASRACVVCGTPFKASKPTARCCGGRCRMVLSRTRRVADVTAKLVAAEQAMSVATDALRELRELVQAGAGKLAP